MTCRNPLPVRASVHGLKVTLVQIGWQNEFKKKKRWMETWGGGKGGGSLVQAYSHSNAAAAAADHTQPLFICLC